MGQQYTLEYIQRLLTSKGTGLRGAEIRLCLQYYGFERAPRGRTSGSHERWTHESGVTLVFANLDKTKEADFNVVRYIRDALMKIEAWERQKLTQEKAQPLLSDDRRENDEGGLTVLSHPDYPECAVVIPVSGEERVKAAKSTLEAHVAVYAERLEELRVFHDIERVVDNSGASPRAYLRINGSGKTLPLPLIACDEPIGFVGREAQIIVPEDVLTHAVMLAEKYRVESPIVAECHKAAAALLKEVGCTFHREEGGWKATLPLHLAGRTGGRHIALPDGMGKATAEKLLEKSRNIKVMHGDQISRQTQMLQELEHMGCSVDMRSRAFSVRITLPDGICVNHPRDRAGCMDITPLRSLTRAMRQRQQAEQCVAEPQPRWVEAMRRDAESPRTGRDGPG